MTHARHVFATLIITLTIAACATFGTTPEAQIKTGANGIESAAKLATSQLQRKRITVTQAKNYQTLLTTASATLDDANRTLVDCRKRTGSTQKSIPDPCQTNIAGDVRLAESVLIQVEKTLKEKE